jgi:hypothetical protein
LDNDCFAEFFIDIFKYDLSHYSPRLIDARPRVPAVKGRPGNDMALDGDSGTTCGFKIRI